MTGALNGSTRPGPTLAVLITYYGERELLRECVESVLAQEGRPDEILVYDDASPHPAEDYLPEGFPGRVVRGAVNRGPCHGRNVLLREATADYVHFHDADDLFDSGWCRRVRETLDETGADVVFTEITSYRDGELLSERVLGLERLEREDLVRFCLSGSMLVPSGTYRRELVLALGGYREELWQTEDYDFHVRMAVRGPRFAVVPEPLVRIRVRAEGRSQKRIEVWTSAVQAVRLLAAEIPAEYRPELAEAAVRAGSVLYKEGALEEARDAFRLAERIGPPDYRGQRGLYRAVARTFGAEAAERFGAWYRSLVPQGFRARLVKRGL